MVMVGIRTPSLSVYSFELTFFIINVDNDVFWMYQCQPYLIKIFLLGSDHSMTTTILELSFKLDRTSQNQEKKTTKLKAHQRSLVLEAEVDKSNKAATESLQELLKEKLRRSNLEKLY